MEAGDTYVLDPLDPVYHEMNSILVCSHHVYKSARSPVIGEKLIMEKEPNGQSIQWICSGRIKRFSDSGPNSVGKLIHKSQVILLHEEALSFAVPCLSYYWEKEEKKTFRSTM